MENSKKKFDDGVSIKQMTRARHADQGWLLLIAKDIMPSIAWRRDRQRDRDRRTEKERETETLPAGTKPRTSHHRSPGGERERQRHDPRAQNQGHHIIDRLEERQRQRHDPRAQNQGHHTIDCLEERGVERVSARRPSLTGREGHRQSDEHWNRFKGNVGKLAHMRDEMEGIWAFRAHRYHIELTELS